MKKINFFITYSLLLLSVFTMDAQVGIGTNTPQGALDITSSDDGLVVPRVALTSTLVVLPVLTGTTSELVYNTNTAGDVTPGFYYLSTATGPWVRLASAGPANAWELLGNAGTVYGTNYLGTSDNVDLAFRRQATNAGRISTTNTSLGLNSYNSNTSTNNTAFGVNALLNSTNAASSNNTAIGFGALDNLGANNTAQTVAVGTNAFGQATTNSNGVAIGFNAAQGTTTGIENTAVGSGALNNNSIGQQNTAIGKDALFTSTGSFNTTLGYEAGRNIGAGGNNTAVGYQAGNVASTSGTSLGYQASPGAFTNSTAIGNGAIAAANNNMKFGNGSIIANHFTNKIGLNAPTIPNGSLDLNVTNDGIVPPKAALTSTLTVLPVVTGAIGELVYNTATVGDVTPGYYYLSTATGPWVRLATSGAFTEVDPKVMSSTTNSVPKWDGTALVDGIITDDGTRVGIGTGALTPNGALEINSTNDGLVIPRVSLLIGTSNSFPLIAPTNSEIIFNTATVGDVTPGFYYWSTSPLPARWIRFSTGASTGWLTTGNSGLSGTTNFIGTTDAIDVAFRRSNAAAGKIGATSTSFGVGALNNGVATNSTAIGNNALANNAGFNNVAVGQNALQASPGLAQFNTAIGVNALPGINVAAAQNNTAVGFNAMGTTTGDISNCTAIGVRALLNVDGSTAARGLNNTAVGYEAGSNITTGLNNTAIGYQAVVGSATADNQIRIGNTAISLATTQIAWTTTSDRRWKNNIKESPLGLDFIKTIRPVSYIRNNDEKGKTEYGFIAQELEDALIKAGDPNNAIISKDDDGMLGVRYNDFISITVKAVQEQQVEIEALRKQNVELMKINEVIMKRLDALEKK